jgi:(2Fe-2S) ferredoxin
MIRTLIQKPTVFTPFISKEDINKLPLVEYTGPTQLVRNQQELESALKELRREKVIGFDTETRPSFRKTDIYLPSLLQLCTRKTAYLIQLSRVENPTGIAELFADPSITKAGVAIRDDLVGLMKLFPFSPESFIDLADLARVANIQNTGLRSLCAIMLGKRISKSAQVSNWAKDELTQKQICYAATDAWISRELYELFRKGGYVRKFDRKALEGPAISDQLKRKVERMSLEKVKHHLFFCNGATCGKCCSAERGSESLAYLQKRLQELQLIEENNAQVALTQVQCFDICQRGPILLIQPEGTWYMSCTPEAIERILQNHIINGKPVRDLILATTSRKK